MGLVDDVAGEGVCGGGDLFGLDKDDFCDFDGGRDIDTNACIGGGSTGLWRLAPCDGMVWDWQLRVLRGLVRHFLFLAIKLYLILIKFVYISSIAGSFYKYF